MTEFVGRTGSRRVYSYPETNRFRSDTGPFARNFAVSDDTNVPILQAGTQVPWSVIESGAPAGVNVPITPKSSGCISIKGVFTIACQSEGDVDVQVVGQVDGVSQPPPVSETVQVPNGSAIAIPFLVNFQGLTVGTTYNVSILLLAEISDALTIVDRSSTLEVIEIPLASG